MNAQPNHVPNASFEHYSYCPSAQNQITGNCTGWSSWTSTSPDYFHVCAGNSIVGIPQNMAGYQSPAHGSAYIGFVYGYWPVFQTREYVTRPIIPLKKKHIYEVSISVSLSDTSGLSTDDLGVYFFDNGPTFINVPTTASRIPVAPQVDYSSYGRLTDKQNWVRLTKYMYADSAYDNIVIGGGFNDPATVDTVYLGSSGNNLSRICYIYCDSVVVRPTIAITIDITDTVMCAGDTIRVPYEVDSFRTLGGNNVFTLQLSDDTGGFTSPVNIGTLASTSRYDTVTGIIPANTPTGTGYIIRLVSSNNADTSFYKKLDNFNTGIKIGNPAKPTAVSNSPVCSGQTLQLYGVTPLTRVWTGPNGFNSTTLNPTLSNSTTAMSGQYILTASIYGCTNSDTETVVVHPSLQPITASVQSLICAGDTIQLTASNTSPSGATYSWTGPGGFSSAAQDTVIANATTGRNGDYIVTASRNGCITKDTVTVTVQPAPNAVTLSGNNPVCSGDTLYLNSTQSTTGVSYNWAGPNSFSASTQNSYIANSTTAATGWYVMTVALGGCTYKDSLYATVNQTPAQPNISYSSPLCVGETLSLSTTASGNYYWKGAGNFTSNQQNPNRTNIQLGDTGSYSLAVTVNGCSSDTAYTHVNINPLPFVAIAASPGAAICSGQQVQFTAYPNQHGGTPGYQWYVNNIAVGNTTTVFTTTTLNNGDIVRCDMTENTKCSSPITDPSNDITMSVNPWLAPKVVISANPGPSIHPFQDITFTAITTDAGANPTYQWRRNGINEAGATGSVWGANAQALSNGDDICVLVRSSYSCPQPDTVLSNCIELEVRLGVNNVANNSERIKIYPNPASTILHIEGAAAGSTVELVDLLGRKHATQQLVGTAVDVSALVPGVYIVRINGRVAGRVVKE